jgi:hypothetical protein
MVNLATEREYFDPITGDFNESRQKPIYAPVKNIEGEVQVHTNTYYIFILDEKMDINHEILHTTYKSLFNVHSIPIDNIVNCNYIRNYPYATAVKTNIRVEDTCTMVKNASFITSNNESNLTYIQDKPNTRNWVLIKPSTQHDMNAILYSLLFTKQSNLSTQIKFYLSLGVCVDNHGIFAQTIPFIFDLFNIENLAIKQAKLLYPIIFDTSANNNLCSILYEKIIQYPNRNMFAEIVKAINNKKIQNEKLIKELIGGGFYTMYDANRTSLEQYCTGLPWIKFENTSPVKRNFSTTLKEQILKRNYSEKYDILEIVKKETIPVCAITGIPIFDDCYYIDIYEQLTYSKGESVDAIVDKTSKQQYIFVKNNHPIGFYVSCFAVNSLFVTSKYPIAEFIHMLKYYINCNVILYRTKSPISAEYITEKYCDPQYSQIYSMIKKIDFNEVKETEKNKSDPSVLMSSAGITVYNHRDIGFSFFNPLNTQLRVIKMLSNQTN